ncbi:MAG: class II fructose-bisphosphatase [Rickettsiales bacterium]|nr:class II fructose-bisphosphatase [Rickettsiales bacterium]
MTKAKIQDFPSNAPVLERNLALETVRVTEAAALASAKWTGLGSEDNADQAAVDAMRKALNTINIQGTIVIGEGERDKAPMLYIGEKVGTGTGPEVDIALDPLEGTTICATGTPNALSVIAIAEKGGFLNAPDVYMEKIAVGGGLPKNVINLDDKIETNLKNLAKAKGCDVSELMVVILDRPRHEELIARVREQKARIQLIGDGDVAGIIATTRSESGVDMYVGIGGAPEGVLAAAALKCVDGQMHGRLYFKGEKVSDEQVERAKLMGIKDLNKIYTIDEMAKGDVMFSATGVTTGWMLQGVRRIGASSALTHSLVMRSRTGTIRFVQTEHNFARKKL